MANPLITNAADESQQQRARMTAKDREHREIADLYNVMSSKSGRRFIWRLLGVCRPLQSIWEPSARIHYNAGQQDIGHWVIAETEKASLDLFHEMQREAREEEEFNG